MWTISLEISVIIPKVYILIRPFCTKKDMQRQASSISENIIKTLKKENSSYLLYQQKGEGPCGVSALNNALAYIFDINLFATISSNKDGYIKSLNEPISNKMKFLVT